MSRQTVLVIVGVAASAVFMWLAARHVDWALMLDSLKQVRPLPLLLGMMCALLAYVAMAVRWKILLREAHVIRFRDAFDFTMIGALAGLVLPQRLGDLAKVALFSRRTGISSSLVFGTLVLDRLSDVIMLLLLGLVLSATGELPAIVVSALLSLAAVTAVLVGILWVGVERWERTAAPLLSRLPVRLTSMAHAILERFASGLQPMRRGRQFAASLGMSAVLWTLAGLALVAYVAAFHLSVPWYAGFFVLLLTNFGGIIPASPGSIGVYHYLAVMAIMLWSSDRSTALGFAVVSHALNLLVIVLAGAGSLARQGLSLRSVRVDSERLVAKGV